MEERDRTLADRLKSFEEEFGKILEPVAFLKQKDETICDTFLKLHELAVSEGVISRKYKLLMHAAITASLSNIEGTAMHLLGAIRAGATEDEIFETAATIIPVAGMPAFGNFLVALKKVKGL